MSGGRGLRSVVMVHSQSGSREMNAVQLAFFFFHSKPLVLSAAHIWGESSQLTQPMEETPHKNSPEALLLGDSRFC